MATLELAAAPERAEARSHGYALGLRLESPEPFPGIQRADGSAPERVTSWTTESAETVEAAWPLAEGRVLLDRRHTDGRLFLRVDAHDELGYRVWAPYYGRHLVAADGGSIASALPRVPPARWQRLFFAQVLPLASALQGLCVFHASAVAVRGAVLAFVGPSGSGKTSLTAHLTALGASFVTDDVLALETTGNGVIAHPGPARLCIESSELRRIPSTQQARLGACVGRSDKLMLEPTPVAGALPLGSVYFLRPDPAFTRIAIESPERPTGKPLLGAGFLTYLRSPAFLERHLETCASVASTVPIFEVELPPSSRAREVAARVLAHCEARADPVRP